MSFLSWWITEVRLGIQGFYTYFVLLFTFKLIQCHKGLLLVFSLVAVKCWLNVASAVYALKSKLGSAGLWTICQSARHWVYCTPVVLSDVLKILWAMHGRWTLVFDSSVGIKFSITCRMYELMHCQLFITFLDCI